MKIRLSLFSIVAVVALGGCATVQTHHDTLAALRSRLEGQLSEPRFAQAAVGVKVISEASGKTVFEHNGDKLLKPASNAKMYTASLALDRLGPDFRIKTSLYASAKPDADGTIRGDLIVYGRGDPSFSSRFNNSNYDIILEPVVKALAGAGVKRIEGDLIGDDSYFHGPEFGSDWTWDDLQESYGAPASALTVQDNCIDLVFKPGKAVGDPCEIETMPKTDILTFENRTETVAKGGTNYLRIYRPVGSSTVYVWGKIAMGTNDSDEAVSVPDPALWFVALLKADLARHGISVGGTVHSIGWLERDTAPFDSSKLVEVASVESPPLREIVTNTLKPSQNQYAQLLLLQVGANSKAERKSRTEDSDDRGLAEMEKFLEEIGIKPGMVFLQEGSGLSRSALVTPSASVQLLAFMAKHRYHATFIDGLPIAGVDGTLRKRFHGTAAAGNVRAKTGSLDRVNTLSGYLTTKGKHKLIFSIMLNNYSPPLHHGDGRSEIDSLVNMLVNYDGAVP